MLKAFAAGVALGLAIMIWDRALPWLDEASEWQVWSGFLTVLAIVALAFGGVRVWLRRDGIFVLAALTLTGCASSVQSKDAPRFTTDAAVSHRLSRDKVPHFHVRFRDGNIGSFTHGFFRAAIGGISKDTAGEIGEAMRSGIARKAISLAGWKLSLIGVDIVRVGFARDARIPQAQPR